MEVADREAEPGVDLKASIGGYHDDTRRLERVVFGEQELPMVVSTWPGEGDGGEDW